MGLAGTVCRMNPERWLILPLSGCLSFGLPTPNFFFHSHTQLRTLCPVVGYYYRLTKKKNNIVFVVIGKSSLNFSKGAISYLKAPLALFVKERKYMQGVRDKLVYELFLLQPGFYIWFFYLGLNLGLSLL